MSKKNCVGILLSTAICKSTQNFFESHCHGLNVAIMTGLFELVVIKIKLGFCVFKKYTIVIKFFCILDFQHIDNIF